MYIFRPGFALLFVLPLHRQHNVVDVECGHGLKKDALAVTGAEGRRGLHAGVSVGQTAIREVAQTVLGGQVLGPGLDEVLAVHAEVADGLGHLMVVAKWLSSFALGLGRSVARLTMVEM